MDKTLSLSGQWEIRPLELEKTREYTSYFDTHEHLVIDTQNSIYTELVGNGVINEKIRFVSDLHWQLRRSFSYEKGEDRCCLEMPGVKSIKINGREIFSFDITDFLRNGENTIEAIATSSFRGDVKLVRSQEGVVYSAHLTPEKQEGKWRIKVKIDYESFKEQEIEATLTLLDVTVKEILHFRKGRETKIFHLEIEEDKVELWSPGRDGRCKLYTASLTLGNTTMDRKVAFRTIEFTEDCRLFVNGKMIFYKGCLWPVSLFPDRRRYEELLNAAVKGYMNLLIIEKGHETHTFYNIADRLGLLVLHESVNEDYAFHPSYISGKIDEEVFDAGNGRFSSYYEECEAAAKLERWVLRRRTDNSHDGVVYSNLLSTVTENGKWNAGHYATRRFYADLVPVMYREKDNLYVTVSNDSDRDEEVDISVKFMEFDSGKRKKRVFSSVIPANTAKNIATLDLRGIDPENEFCYVKMRTKDIHREFTLLLQDDFRLCNLKDPRLEFEARMINSRAFEVRLRAQKPAFGVILSVEGIEGTFSDGFFEVRPSSDKSVIFTAHRDISLREFEDSLRIESLYSAMN